MGRSQRKRASCPTKENSRLGDSNPGPTSVEVSVLANGMEEKYRPNSISLVALLSIFSIASGMCSARACWTFPEQTVEQLKILLYKRSLSTTDDTRDTLLSSFDHDAARAVSGWPVRNVTCNGRMGCTYPNETSVLSTRVGCPLFCGLHAPHKVPLCL